MQSTYQLKLSDHQQEVLHQGSIIPAEMLTEIIEANAEALGYMLQSYYSREKVSRITVIPGSVNTTNQDTISLKLEYIIEEFNACSAIDTEKKDQMTVLIERGAGILLLKGESWPEL